MTLLYFFLDVCVYNYTSFRTDFLLHALLEKRENKLFYFGSILWIDWLLVAQGKLFLLYAILYGINKKIKLSYQEIKFVFWRFLIVYILYKIGIFLLFHQFVFDCIGFFFNLVLLFLLHKKF